MGARFLLSSPFPSPSPLCLPSPSPTSSHRPLSVHLPPFKSLAPPGLLSFPFPLPLHLPLPATWPGERCKLTHRVQTLAEIGTNFVSCIKYLLILTVNFGCVLYNCDKGWTRRLCKNWLIILCEKWHKIHVGDDLLASPHNFLAEGDRPHGVGAYGGWVGLGWIEKFGPMDISASPGNINQSVYW